MKSMKLTLTAILVLSAGMSLTACDTLSNKETVDNSRTPARAYVAAPGSSLESAENKWMRVETRTASASQPAASTDLGSIEPAAGPGAVAPQASSAPVIIEGGRIER